MTQSFLLVLDLPDDVDPNDVVEELSNDLSDFDVISLAPMSTSINQPGAPTETAE